MKISLDSMIERELWMNLIYLSLNWWIWDEIGLKLEGLEKFLSLNEDLRVFSSEWFGSLSAVDAWKCYCLETL